MACSQVLKSIINDCAPSVGGVRIVYVANHSDIQSIQVTEGQVVGITMAGSAKFKKFTFRKNTASMTSTLAVDPTTGNTVTTDVTMSFLKQDTQKRLALSALALSELAVIVVDNNGLAWYLGEMIPAEVSAATGETGTAFSDRNGYSVTIQSVGGDFPMEVKTSQGSTSDSTYVHLDELVEE